MNKRYLVVGRGLVGAEAFGKLNEFEVIGHSSFWNNPMAYDYDGYVCAAALSTEALCQSVPWLEVVRGNVELPVEMMRVAALRRIPFVAFSTSGVYNESGLRSEFSDVEPQNRYTASKLMMEHELMSKEYDKCYIFRIPFVCLFTDHERDLESRVSKWTQCETVPTSILYREELVKSVRSALESAPDRYVPPGIYNVASETVQLSDFVTEKFNYSGEMVPADSMGRTPSTCLELTRARRAGLL